MPNSLKSKFEENKEAKAKIRTEIAKLKQELAQATSQGKKFQEQIKQLEREVKDELMQEAHSSENSKDIQTWLTQRREALRAEVEQTIHGIETLRKQLKPSSQDTVTGHDVHRSVNLVSLEIAKQKANAESQTCLENQDIASCTDKLRNVYHQKFKEEVDIDKAVDSALFLNSQKLSKEIEGKAIEAAIHLIKHLDATFNEVYIHNQTREIVIVKPSDAKDPALSKVEFDLFGRLKINGKKQKAFVVASLVGKPDELILPVKAEMAYGSAAFAGGTPMLPGGTAGIEDLGGLEKGNMNILAIAVEREFKEETRGNYQLVRGTLKSRGQISAIREDALFFEAGAEPIHTVADVKGNAEPTNTITTMENSETKGVVLLNIQEMVKEHQLSEKYISPSRIELTIKHVLPKEVQRLDPQLITGTVPQKQEDFRDSSQGGPQWEQYFTAYCTGHLVDYILKRIPAFGKQKQGVKYRLLKGSGDASWRNLSLGPDQGEWVSESAKGRVSGSANRRSGGSSSSSTS